MRLSITLLNPGKRPSTEVGWSFLWVVFFGLVIAGVGAYAVYKYRIRVRFAILEPFLVLALCLPFMFFHHATK